MHPRRSALYNRFMHINEMAMKVRWPAPLPWALRCVDLDTGSTVA